MGISDTWRQTWNKEQGWRHAVVGMISFIVCFPHAQQVAAPFTNSLASPRWHRGPA